MYILGMSCTTDPRLTVQIVWALLISSFVFQCCILWDPFTTFLQSSFNPCSLFSPHNKSL